MKTALLVVLIGGTMLAAGAEQRGTAAATAGLQVNGAAVPATGAKTWPVMAGDEIRTASAPTVLTLRDGSKILLGANSAAKLETTAAGAESLRLVSGGMQYTMSNEAKTQLVVNNQPLVVTPGSTGTAGTVGLDAATATPKVSAQAPKAAALPPLSRRR
jgi:ferric-dicitrate binding protein FerR (iron transport regulator)